MGVAEWFSGFCTGLRIGQEQRASVGGRTSRIAGQLNHDFRGLDSKTANRFYVGSYGRSTAIPSVSDVDLLYELPADSQCFQAFEKVGHWEQAIAIGRI